MNSYPVTNPVTNKVINQGTKKNTGPTVKPVKNKFPVMIAVLLAAAFIWLPAQSLFPAVSSLKGQVKEKDTGTPLEGVKITLTVINKASARYKLESDSKGNFFKTGLTNGVYQVSFLKEGYVPAQTTVRLAVGKQKEVIIALEKMKGPQGKKSYKLIKDAQDLMAKGKYDKAIAKITTALKEHPDSFILYYNRGVGYEKSGDSANAVKDYKKTLELKPDFIMALAALGKIAAKKADFSGAAAYYKKAFDLGITDTVALYNYGACLINLSKNDEAIVVFNKLLILDPNYAEAHYHLGIIYVGLNKPEQAKTYFKKFLELDPNNSNADVAKEILETL